VVGDGLIGCVVLLNLCVQDVEWLKSITSLPILLKGIVTAEDGNE
jgi:isopentenyl diphosphate isomerase/L-lactate dehydrogenase-like FMN-dependent dehydrogenase